jgi:flagellar export protein FliJ
MAVSRALRRLLGIRDLEEEQHRLALESAMGELRSLENALVAMLRQERRGRALVKESARSGDLQDRLAGVVESRAAQIGVAMLAPRIAATKNHAARLREAYLQKRIERRQAETLIEETEAKEAMEAERRSQQGLDDSYRSRLFRNQREADAEDSTAIEGSGHPEGRPKIGEL